MPVIHACDRKGLRPRRSVVFSGPYSTGAGDEFMGYGGWFQKLKKAISIKNVVKVVKKAAPVAAVVATGGVGAAAAFAVKSAAKALTSSAQVQQITASAPKQSANNVFNIGAKIQRAAATLQERQLAETLAPVPSVVPPGIDITPATTRDNLAAVPSIPSMARSKRQLERVAAPKSGFSIDPQTGAMVAAGVLALVLLTRKR